MGLTINLASNQNTCITKLQQVEIYLNILADLASFSDYHYLHLVEVVDILTLQFIHCQLISII